MSEDEIADIEAKLDAAKAAFAAQKNAQNQARAATLSFHLAAEALTKAGASAILKVRATAGLAEDNDVYALALLPPPEKPSRIGEPDTPYKFVVELLPNGAVQLKWKCQNPRNSEGTVYEVWRQLRDGGESQYGAFEFLGIVGEKRFTDARLPRGADSAIYQVTAVRSKRRGLSSFHIVNFGRGPALAALAPAGTRAAA